MVIMQDASASAAFAAHVVLRRLYGARHRRCVYDDPAPRRVAGSPLPDDAGDWGILLLVLFGARRRILARMQAPGYESWLLWHIFAAELVLILAPFTKLSHIVLYFMSRGQLGMDYAIKRAARRAAPLSPGNPPGLPAYWRTTCLKASFATDGPSTPRKI